MKSLMLLLFSWWLKISYRNISRIWLMWYFKIGIFMNQNNSKVNMLFFCFEYISIINILLTVCTYNISINFYCILSFCLKKSNYILEVSLCNELFSSLAHLRPILWTWAAGVMKEEVYGETPSPYILGCIMALKKNW